MRTCLWLLVALCGLLPLTSSADDAPFKEGKHYKLVPNSEKVPDAHKIEVLEFFWYGCPHCYQFESDITAWLARKPDGVVFKRVPNNLGRAAGEMHALAYHVAETLNIVKRVHPLMFKAIHDKKQATDTVSDICFLFVQAGGVTDEKCRTTADSFDVRHAIDHDDFLIRRYGVVVVPTLVVDGHYLTNASMAGGMGKLIKLVNFLIEKRKVERGFHQSLPDDEPIARPAPMKGASRPRPPPLF